MGLMTAAVVVLLLISLQVWLPLVGSKGSSTYNVVDYGALGDGHSNDAHAFMETWKFGCQDPATTPIILVPKQRTFFLKHVSFAGPCRSPIQFLIEGNIVAPDTMWRDPEMNHLIEFKSIKGLFIGGSGQIDGRGHAWWPCKTDHETMGIIKCEGVHVIGLNFKDSPSQHLTIEKSSDVHITGLGIHAPEDSPNTDGIHVEETTHSDISGCIIGTGDDCISIGTGTYNITIGHINCGPGHGISIGSLGKYDSKAQVEKIHVFSSSFINTMFGVRIKTWQGGSGYARGIIFENLYFTQVNYPIVIDQFYCEYVANGGCPIKPSAVKVSDVQYIETNGTTNRNMAISLNCSETEHCTNILMKTVNIQGSGSTVEPKSFCINARGKKQGIVIPEVPCLTN